MIARTSSRKRTPTAAELAECQTNIDKIRDVIKGPAAFRAAFLRWIADVLAAYAKNEDQPELPEQFHKHEEGALSLMSYHVDRLVTDRPYLAGPIEALARERAAAIEEAAASTSNDNPKPAPARTDGNLLAEVEAERQRDTADALYVVSGIADAEVLTLLGSEAVVAARTEQVVEWATAAADAGRPVALVGSVGAAVRGPIRRAAPHAMLRRLKDPEHPSLALGIDPSVRTPTAAELEKAARTWRQLAAEAVEDVAPTADGPADEDADYVPPPVSALPPVLREFVERGAAAQGVDPAFYLVPMLPALAGAIGTTRRVALNEDWQEPAVLWGAPVAPSGCGKSPALREVLAPITQRNRELHERSEALRQSYEAEREARRSDREASGPPPEPPPVLRACVQDCTLEALGARHADNRRGLLVAVDELASWVGGFDRYRAGGDAATWLSLHNGDPLQVDRRAERGSFYLPRSAVSVCGSIQPAVAKRIVATEQHKASGLAARLLWAMPPLTAPRWTDRTIGDAVRGAYRRVVSSLLDLEPEDGEPVVLQLSPKAREVLVRWVNDSGQSWLAAVRSGEPDVAATLAKLRGGAARIALVLCLARHAEDGTASLVRQVDEIDARAGVQLCQWFEGESRRLYAKWADDEAQAVASRERGSLQALADRLSKHLTPGTVRTMRELRAATGNNVPADRMRAALAILVGNGGARRLEPDRSRPGRPAEAWEGLDRSSQGVCAS